MTKEANPRAASTRIGSANAKTLAGQIRHDLRRGPQPKYVDAKRLEFNRVLVEPLPPGQMRAICEERRALRDTQRRIKSNAAVATRGIISFGAEAAGMFEILTPDQQDTAFRELAEVIAARLATTLHGLVVHRDEATIHAHYQLAAFNVHGNPIAKTTSPRVLAELQDLTAEVMGRHCPGIERGRRYGDRLAAGADYADIVHRSVAELHRTLPADLAAKRQAVADLAEAEQAAAARVDEMQDRVQKLEGKAQLTDKELKRLTTYEKRLADRVAELESAKAKAEAARVAAEAGVLLAQNQAEILAGAATALAQEMSSGTLRRQKDGKLTAATPAALKAGGEALMPAIYAAADARTAIEYDQAEAKRALSVAKSTQAAAETKLAEAEASHASAQAKHELLAQRETKLDGVMRRIRSIVENFGNVLGLRLPRLISESLDMIEKDMEKRIVSAPPEMELSDLSDAHSGPGF